MAEIWSGKDVAAALSEQLAARAAALKERGLVPKLAIVRCGENPADLAYERGALKRAALVGVETRLHLLPADVTKEALLEELEEINADASVHGCLLFRPLPAHLRADTDEICNRLLPGKDVDGMTDLSGAGIFMGKDLGFAPCTPEAVMQILAYHGVDCTGKRAVVIGRSLVVGKPVAMLLLAAHATVTMCHTRTRDVAAVTRKADIIVTAAGAIGSLTKEHVRPGQIVIDVSMNWDENKINAKGAKGAMAGDAVFDEVEPVVAAITPVPGGVGAVTTTCLIGHVIEAAEK